MASPGFPNYTPLEFTGAPTYIPVGQSMQGYKPDYEPLQSTMSPATFAKKYPYANELMFGKPKKPKKPAKKPAAPPDPAKPHVKDVPMVKYFKDLGMTDQMNVLIADLVKRGYSKD